MEEYWIVSPQDYTFLIYTLENGSFVDSRLYSVDDTITTPILPGFSLDLKDLFSKAEF